MKFSEQTHQLTLSAETVDQCHDLVQSFCESQKLSKNDAVRYALTVDTILLDFLTTHPGEDVTLVTGRHMMKSFISLSISGEQANSFQTKERDNFFLQDSILTNLGLSPDYRYEEGVNRYHFALPQKKNGSLALLFLCTVAAFVLGYLALLLPQNIQTGLYDYVLTPLYSLFLKALGCISGPMIFLSVTWGLYGIGDASTLKKVGKKLILGFIGSVFLLTLISFFFQFPLYDFEQSTSQVSSEFSSIIDMVLDIVPSDLFSPFANGNTLQIILLAVILGITLLFLTSKTSSIAKAVEQINLIVQHLIQFLCRLIPYFILVVIMRLIISNEIAACAQVLTYVVLCIATLVVSALIVLISTAIRVKVNPFRLAGAALPSSLLGLTTASSSVAFTKMLQIVREKFGVKESIGSFAIPLGVVISKHNGAILFLAAGLFFAQYYNVGISVSWCIMLILISSILGIATPPIPGGAISSFAVLFAQLGIPPEALALALACDIVLDFFATGEGCFTLPLQTLSQAYKMGMVDENIFRKNLKPSKKKNIKV